MITKKYRKLFKTQAKTLPVKCVSKDSNHIGYSERKHKSGWTIRGEACEDYHTWVSLFNASHPKYGFVQGNFEKEISASSHEALEHFLEHHPFEEWDYADI